MNKEEFLNKLRKELNILEDKEVEDIISEYEGYIEEKVNRGLTEEEAVKELGDINEIVNDLLAAYKVKQKDTNVLNRFINKVSQGFDYILNELSHKSGKEILKFVIEIALIVLIIVILKIPFLLLKDLGWNIFGDLGAPISSILYGIWSFIVELTYLILAVILFIKIIEKRYFQGFSEKIIANAEEEFEKKEKNEEEPKKKLEKKKERNGKEEKTENKLIINPKKKGITDMIVNICIGFLKLIVIMCLLGVICYLIAIVCALGLGIYLLIKGVTYFGSFILLVALFQGGFLLLELGVDFVFNKKIKAKHILVEVIVVVILTGTGLALSTVEIANTEIIYDSVYEETKTVTKEIEMSDDLVLYGKYNIIIDNTLEDTIKIEYVYPDIEEAEVKIALRNYNNGYYLDYEVSNLKWNKKYLNKIINNLKEKKIYVDNFDIEKNIYLSEENKKELLENKENNQNVPSVIYEFTNTYNVLNIEESNDYDYLYLTIRKFQFEEVTTVKVPRALAQNVEENQAYEFTFKYNYPEVELIEGSDEEIFEKCKLISINLTTKVGLEQVQESPVP